jgi:hypothetical protein
VELTALTAYAKQKYGIDEEHKWADFPQFSVLSHPVTGKWIALLMRQWDMDTGTEYFCCDIRCGVLSHEERYRPYISFPFRMRGREWTGVNLTYVVKPEFVLSLIDRAVELGNGQGFTVVLEQKNGAAAGSNAGRETVIPPRPGNRPYAAGYSAETVEPRESGRFSAMRRLYVYGSSAQRDKIENFVRQGTFMKDYEDEFPWTGEFFRYYPTYHDMNDNQLRGYFSWRTRARKGVFEKIPLSAAYIYVYELLNGIGVSSPADAVEKMKEFLSGFVDAGYGDDTMRRNVTQWAVGFAVMNDLPRETVLEVEDEKIRTLDRSLEILKQPENASNEEIVNALEALSGRKISRSPVIKNFPGRGERLFGDVWRLASTEFRENGKDLFEYCFGRPDTHGWQPLRNAIVQTPAGKPLQEYELSCVRLYRCKGGRWTEKSFAAYDFPSGTLESFVHGMDGLLRRYLKTGNYLHKKDSDETAKPYVERVAAIDAKEVLEASRPVITVDLSSLDRIRDDALVTRDSLLADAETEAETAEERDEEAVIKEEAATEEAAEEQLAEETAEEAGKAEAPEIQGIPLDADSAEILRVLLEGGRPDEIIRTRHLMPSVVADSINEAFFGEFGDSVVSSDGSAISIVEDYRDELAEMLGI